MKSQLQHIKSYNTLTLSGMVFISSYTHSDASGLYSFSYSSSSLPFNSFKAETLHTIIHELVQQTILTNLAQRGFHEESSQVMNHPMDKPSSVRYFTFGYPSVSRKVVYVRNVFKINFYKMTSNIRKVVLETRAASLYQDTRDTRVPILFYIDT